MSSPVFLHAGTVTAFRKAALVVALLSAAAVVFSGLRLAQGSLARRSMAEEVALHQATLTQLQQIAEQGRRLRQDAKPVSVEVVAALQSRLERAAKTQGCRIEEFQASPDRSPYLSAYRLGDPDQGWEQVAIRLRITGDVRSVSRVLDVLRESDAPLEMDSLDITRTSADDYGRASVAAGVVMRVLLRQG
ncbi:MAG TPA: GspMb/PilO family protein, partial [Fimbriimonadaceae bacterium]|nr:GspMb/PilO family protein [Fimbriimonadaceae bacterium]